MPHPTRMSPTDTTVLVIDIQEKLMPLILHGNQLIRNTAFLIDGAQLHGIPVHATEQYPRGLGPTVPELAKRLPARPEKVGFSSCAIADLVEKLRSQARPKILLAGIESHVCVAQTALDLLGMDFRVYLAVDAISCRYAIDHETALRRLEKAGAVLTTCEAAVFEWTGGSNHPQFKQVSQLVQQRMKDMPAS